MSSTRKYKLSIPGFKWASQYQMMREAVLPMLQNYTKYQPSDMSFSPFMLEFQQFCLKKQLLTEPIFIQITQLFGILNNLSRCLTVDFEKLRKSQCDLNIYIHSSGYLYLDSFSTTIHRHGCKDREHNCQSTHNCSHIDHTKDCLEIDNNGHLLHVTLEEASVNLDRNKCDFVKVSIFQNGILVDNNFCKHTPKCIGKPILHKKPIIDFHVNEMINAHEIQENQVCIHYIGKEEVDLNGNGLLFNRLKKVFQHIKNEPFEVLYDCEKFPYEKETIQRLFVITDEMIQSWIEKKFLVKGFQKKVRKQDKTVAFNEEQVTKYTTHTSPNQDTINPCISTEDEDVLQIRGQLKIVWQKILHLFTDTECLTESNIVKAIVYKGWACKPTIIDSILPKLSKHFIAISYDDCKIKFPNHFHSDPKEVIYHHKKFEEIQPITYIEMERERKRVKNIRSGIRQLDKKILEEEKKRVKEEKKRVKEEKKRVKEEEKLRVMEAKRRKVTEFNDTQTHVLITVPHNNHLHYHRHPPTSTMRVSNILSMNNSSSSETLNALHPAPGFRFNPSSFRPQQSLMNTTHKVQYGNPNFQPLMMNPIPPLSSFKYPLFEPLQFNPPSNRDSGYQCVSIPQFPPSQSIKL